MRKYVVILALLIVVVAGFIGCGDLGDPLDNMYTSHLYPGADATYNVGSAALRYLNGFFVSLNVGGLPVGTGNVTASANMDNNTIIRGDGGALGIQDSGVTIDDDNDVSGIRDLNITRTFHSVGDIETESDIHVDNSVYITNDLEVTDNAEIDGNLTMGEYINMVANPINDIKTLNMTDPTELTINAGVITKTQGFHTVDTEGDAPSDYLDTINGGVAGDILILSAANDAREVILTRDGNIRFPPDHMLEAFSFASPSGSSGTYYTGGYYAAPLTSITLTQVSPTLNYGSANSPYGAHAFLVAAGAGTVNAGSCSIVVSGASIDEDGTRTAGDSETIVADITTMALNSYYQTTKRWLGTVTYTMTPVGAATYSATFNYGRAAYDSFNERLHTAKLVECMGRAGANDTGFDVQLLHHKTTGWTYSAAAFIPGTTPICSLLTDYGVDNDLVTNERFKYEREVNTTINGINGVEGLLVRIVTTANKAVEFMDISIYVEALPNDHHLKNTGQSMQLVYNGTNWMKQ